ncbi:MAG: type I glyceraldehyde-3-phosphate dehydrogenase [Bdellovibrionales bacterium]|nr:type I glyceraldehyde-3-phosphate dehydrogenase [Bdellovibrionales bacterium]
MSQKLRVGINGFGRIGRILFRSGWDNVEFVGINNGSGTVDAQAHFLKYDSAHGRFSQPVDYDDNNIIVGDKKIPMVFEKDPSQIPWGDWGADIVFECTGIFKDSEANQKHIQAGAKKVIVSAPAKVDATFVYGINHKTYDPNKHNVVSNASCTTNCLAPVAKVLNDSFGIESALMTTVHAYTNDQRVLDSSHSDLRRARAAAVSMIPTSTGAAKAVGEVLPELKGKVHGMAVRVPTPNVSLVDLNANLKKSVTAKDINEALIAAANGELKGILACTNDEVVSVDMNGCRESSIVDLHCTTVIQDTLVKVLSWYDNETGFSCRMLDLAQYMADQGL